MASPLATAVRGKGIFTLISRSYTIASRYGISAGKMDHALSQLADVLNEFNCKATIPITASALARQPALSKKYRAQGLELAVHGYTHVDYHQLLLEQQREHLSRARQIFEQAGIPIVGFRSPYLRWNEDLLRVLEENGFDYDSSQALAWDVIGEKTSAYQRVLTFYGAQMAEEYPALPRLSGNLVRIPYCLPDDEAIIERSNIPGCPKMSEIWLEMLERIYAAGELFTLGIHPERALLCKDALRAVLKKARSLSPAIWIARLSDITSWYRSLGNAKFEAQPHLNNGWRITVRAPAGATILARSLEVEAPRKFWGNEYEQILSNELIIRGKKFPWIGLPPDAPETLQSFIKHQGYLFEISTSPLAFSYYLDLKTFQTKDERPLLFRLETDCKPLLRLGRWPWGAQAALSITGDVDAFSLWDFGMRMLNR